MIFETLKWLGRGGLWVRGWQKLGLIAVQIGLRRALEGRLVLLDCMSRRRFLLIDTTLDQIVYVGKSKSAWNEQILPSHH
jgi:hypothetical protein